MAAFVRVLKQKYNPPKPVTESLAGKTVLLTGANSGLGLEAAKKIAALDAEKLIITTRDATKGERTKQIIESWIKDPASGKASSHTKVQVMSLDMSDPENVKSFARSLKAQVPRIDAVILNAGVHRGHWSQLKTGFEEDLQVNTISTTLLGLLLLPLLVDSAKDSNAPNHLTFVSSGLATTAKSSSMQKFYNSPNGLKEMSEKTAWHGAMAEYQLSKLLLEYSMRHMAHLPLIQSASGPRVIVNTACPGMCKSDLGRDMLSNVVLRFLGMIFFALFARSAEAGSNAYISAITRDASSHGELWKDDQNYDAGTMITSQKGKKFGDKMWKEIVEVVKGIEPAIGAVVDA